MRQFRTPSMGQKDSAGVNNSMGMFLSPEEMMSENDTPVVRTNFRAHEEDNKPVIDYPL